MSFIRGVAESTVYTACFFGFVYLSFEIKRRLLLRNLNVFLPERNFLKDDDEAIIIFDESEDDEIEMVEKTPPPYTEVDNNSVFEN